MRERDGDKTWHIPVLVEETVEGWYREGGEYYVDGTVGGGGHAAVLLERDSRIKVLGIDRDLESIERARQTLRGYGERVVLCHGSYADVGTHLQESGWPGQVDGILLDLGVNSHQLDEAERGFSFAQDGPLDMRFQQDALGQATAADLVNTLPERDLMEIFRDWGEEPQARQAARAIVKAREVQLFQRTSELRQCLHQALGWGKRKKSGIDPATLCFQGLRIAVNREFEHLDQFLQEFPNWLVSGGRIAVISFHSLEDRRIKQAFRGYSQGCVCPPDLPVCGCGFRPILHPITVKPIRPAEGELELNNRARSARLRVAEKL